MLDEKICELREKLNRSISDGKDYSIIYELSIELDNLISKFYEKKLNLVWKNIKVEGIIMPSIFFRK